jgi:hypothetical protein
MNINPSTPPPLNDTHIQIIKEQLKPEFAASGDGKSGTIKIGEKTFKLAVVNSSANLNAADLEKLSDKVLTTLIRAGVLNDLRHFQGASITNEGIQFKGAGSPRTIKSKEDFKKDFDALSQIITGEKTAAAAQPAIKNLTETSGKPGVIVLKEPNRAKRPPPINYEALRKVRNDNEKVGSLLNKIKAGFNKLRAGFNRLKTSYRQFENDLMTKLTATFNKSLASFYAWKQRRDVKRNKAAENTLTNAFGVSVGKSSFEEEAAKKADLPNREKIIQNEFNTKIEEKKAKEKRDEPFRAAFEAQKQGNLKGEKLSSSSQSSSEIELADFKQADLFLSKAPTNDIKTKIVNLRKNYESLKGRDLYKIISQITADPKTSLDTDPYSDQNIQLTLAREAIKSIKNKPVS